MATGLLKPGDLTTTMGQLCRDHVILEAHNSWDLHIILCSSEVTHGGGDQSGSQAVAKLAETVPEPGCQMSVCFAAYTSANSRQPPPPTDFSRQFKDDM